MTESEFLHLSPHPGVQIVLTTRQVAGAEGRFGFNLAAHVNDSEQAVTHNRKLLQQHLAPIAEPIWLEQVHGNRVLAFDGLVSKVPQGDGSFTRLSNLPLAILTADCLPVVLWSERELAVVHAGWRGLASNILEVALTNFSGRVSAWLGPAISGDNYEVDEAVTKHFPHSPALTPVTDKPGHFQFAINEEARYQLQRLGIEEVTDSAICTALDERFYSHRHEGPTGRFATIAWLES